jgi:hypothetical protein
LGAPYILTARANEAIDALVANLKSKVGKVVVGRGGLRYILSSAEAMRQYSEGVRRIVNDGGYIESHDGRTISVKCSDCGLSQVLYAKVTRYRCRCNPHRDRATFQDIQIGDSP